MHVWKLSRDVDIYEIYVCQNSKNKNVFYIDDDHLSLKGSELVIKEMSKNINFFKK